MSSARLVPPLHSVTMLPAGPPFRLAHAKKGAAREGVRFETRLFRFLAGLFPPPFTVLHGPWLEYRHGEGKAYCQPDIVISHPHFAPVVVEAKLSQKPGAYGKLARLYGPLVSWLYRRTAVLIQAYRNTTGLGPGSHLRNPLDWPFASTVVPHSYQYIK